MDRQNIGHFNAVLKFSDMKMTSLVIGCIYAKVALAEAELRTPACKISNVEVPQPLYDRVPPAITAPPTSRGPALRSPERTGRHSWMIGYRTRRPPSPTIRRLNSGSAIEPQEFTTAMLKTEDDWLLARKVFLLPNDEPYEWRMSTAPESSKNSSRCSRPPRPRRKNRRHQCDQRSRYSHALPPDGSCPLLHRRAPRPS